ncbi:RNA pseudouridine synthase, partial [Pelagibacterales bacterium SAG-MED23]|nr:RNA pseudouridine synthase [Pelagibacterales bacterium SAG-MED23]
MKKTINVDTTYVDMRIDRFLRKYFETIPQSLIERSLRSGKIKLNKRKIKSSTKLKINDLIDIHGLDIKREIITKKV